MIFESEQIAIRTQEVTDCKQSGDEESNEGQATKAFVEVIDSVEYQWEGFEPQVEDGVWCMRKLTTVEVGQIGNSQTKPK